MTAARVFAAFCLTATALAGCSSSPSGEPAATQESETAVPSQESPSPSEEVNCPPTPLDVVIDYQLELDPSGGVLVHAQTNLPDTAELGASFFSEPAGFLAQDSAAVEGGEADFGPFSDKETPLRGTYDFSITLPIARNQPEAVQTCLGDAGELMTGPLVSADEITGDLVAERNDVVTLE